MKMHPFAVLIPVCAIAAAGIDPPAGDETQALDGTWVVESVVRDPQEDQPGEGKGLRILVKGDRIVAKLPGKEKPVGTMKIRLNPKQKPRAVDFLINGDKTTVRAIYEVKGDTLRVCWSPPGKDRPSEFAAKPRNGHGLVVLERARP